MATGISLHIGLNYVNPNSYGGWNGELRGCINDARAMQQIADRQGFRSSILTDAQATSVTVVNRISEIARQLNDGDIFFLTYSGHGGQVPDPLGEETDGQNETWVLYDRELLDNELYVLWGQFRRGVRIIVTSDSCHSGTVVKSMMREMNKAGLGNLENKAEVKSRMVRSYSREVAAPEAIRTRNMPARLCIEHYLDNKETYDMFRNLATPKDQVNVEAGLILISGCMDDELSYDGSVNGYFTENLLAVWNNGAYSGAGYSAFRQSILSRMTAYPQTPNYMKLGPDMPLFESQKPFTVAVGSGSASGGSSAGTGGTDTGTSTERREPSISGPQSWGASQGAPVFQVDKGVNPYYYVELATDSNLFNSAAYGNNRNTSNFYASWNDTVEGGRLYSVPFRVPERVWASLKNSSRIYYRIGSTSSQNTALWENWMVNISDDRAASAPYMQITPYNSGNTGSSGSTGDPGSSGTGIGTNGTSLYLGSSVGNGGVNRQEDVRCIQELLNQIPSTKGGTASSPILTDGVFGSQTAGAIQRFQSVQELSVSGRVEPNGNTFLLMKLSAGKVQIY